MKMWLRWTADWRKGLAWALVAGVSLAVFGAHRRADAGEPAVDPREQRIEQLERAVRELAEQIQALKRERADEKTERQEQVELMEELAGKLEEMDGSPLLDPASWVNKFEFGGYGEMHANFTEGDSGDQFDLHRLVLYIGYDFNEWIKFRSETEVEHAFVKDKDGELSMEQAYVDFLLSDSLNFRVGRILTPLGIVNKTHEPPRFNGVERPLFATNIIPTTWSSDGVGIFGSVTPSLRYEAYVVGGLDGSMFTPTTGIRNGRIKERPSLNDPAVTGRVDYYPLAGLAGGSLRVGLSSYYGGLDNGDQGADPGVHGNILINSADFECSVSRFDFRGVVAHQDISNARQMGAGTASEIMGWYLEGAYHFWPEKWKTGKLERSDAVVFVRYDEADTQYKMPSGVAADPTGDRQEWTFGVSFYPTPNFVIKGDYQVRKDDAHSDPRNGFNFGAGWEF